jgi:hypothetical protein
VQNVPLADSSHLCPVAARSLACREPSLFSRVPQRCIVTNVFVHRLFAGRLVPRHNVTSLKASVNSVIVQGRRAGLAVAQSQRTALLLHRLMHGPACSRSATPMVCCACFCAHTAGLSQPMFSHHNCRKWPEEHRRYSCVAYSSLTRRLGV